MVAIVSGNSLGLNLTSFGTLGQQGVGGSAVQGRNGQSVYVNVANGNLVVQDEDERLKATGQDAVSLRTYNSQGLFDDDNADNWRTDFEVVRVASDGSSRRRISRDGSVQSYAYDAGRGLYVASEGPGAHDTLRYVAADGQYEWRDGDTGAMQRFEAGGEGRLVLSRDASGNTLQYWYGYAFSAVKAVTSDNGDGTYYDYVGNNLSQVRTVAAGCTTSTVLYAYDASNRLASVTVDLSPADGSTADGNAYQTKYTYDGASRRIASITQSDGSSLRFTYVDAGGGNFRVASVTDGLNQTSTFTYTLVPGAARFTTVTDAQGLVTRYDTDAAGRLVKITAPTVSGGTTPTTRFAYDASGKLASVTDGEGRVVTYAYDASGNQVLQRDQAGNTVTRTFDANNQPLTETLWLQPDPDGGGPGQPAGAQTTRHVYDAGGHNLLRFTLSADGRVTEYRYDAHGLQVAAISYRGATYPVAGLAANATLSESALAAWAGAQDMTATQRVDSTYDVRGQLQSTTTYAKVDVTGAGVADGTQSVQRYVHDQAGHLLQAISGNNGTTTYTYDGLGRLLSTTDALRQVTLTQYDDAHGKTLLTQANGLVITSTYDAGGRLVAVLQSNAAAALGQTNYWYDAGGHLRMTQDATGVRQWMFYDAAGRKTADVDGNGTMTEYGYDGSGLLTSTVTYATAVNTASLVDASGLPLTALQAASIRPPSTSADAREWRAYDAAQRLVKVGRSFGNANAVAVTENRYDGESHLVQVVQYANQLTAASGQVAPGAIGTPASSGQDRVTRNFYDGDGHLAGTLDAEGGLVTYTYNAAGARTERIAYATPPAAGLRAAGTLAQLIPTASAVDIHAVSIYNAKGQLAAEVDGESYLTEYVYDAQGNLAQTVRYANRVTAPVTSASTLAAIRPASSAADQATTRVFDALDRLVQETSPQGVVTRYAYDAVGKLVSTSRAVGTSEVRTVLTRHDLQGRLTGELSGEGAALLTGNQTQAQVDAIWAQYGARYAYDAVGRRISATDASGATTWYYYDADSHLALTVNALGEVEESRYDGAGRLIEQDRYAGRIGTAGLTGGLVTSAVTSAVASIRSGSYVTATYTYASDGHAVTSTDGNGNTVTYVYNAFGEKIETDTALGSGRTLTETYTIDRRGLRTGTDQDPAGINAITSTVYDAFGRAIQVVDANGNVQQQAFDRLGRVVSTRDALNLQRTTTYDAFARVLTHTDALGNSTRYTYDTAARAMSVTTPEGVVSTTVYDRFGEVQSLTDGNGLVTSYSYDRNGNLLKTTTPLTTSSSTYDAAGRLIQTTDAGGRQVAYAYDAANRVLTRRVDPNGSNLTTTYAYDGKGQQVSVTDPNGTVTTMAYDGDGNVLRRTVDPAGLNRQTVYAYDASGNVLSVTSPAGAVTLYAFDLLGRRISQVVDPAGLNLRQTWTYDKDGNAVASADALGNVTRRIYDADGRLVYVIDSLGNVRQTTYDAEGRVVRQVAYATPISTAGLPAAPTLSQVQALVVSQPAQDAVQRTVYDRDGRMTASVDGVGAVTAYSYDRNGNVVSRVRYARRIDVASWTPGAPLPVMPDAAHDERVATVYDALNRAVYTLDGTGAVVAQAYDGSGNLVQRIAYASAIAPNTPVTQPAIAAAVAAVANTARDASVRNVYDAAGRLAWSVDGTGAVTQRVYDKDGNIVQQLAYANAVAAGASPSSVVASASDRITSMAYDAAGRLVLQVDALHAVTEQVFDGNGNVVRRTSYANPIGALPALGTAATAAAIRAAVSVNAAADRTSVYGFDAAGRQVLAIDAVGPLAGAPFDTAGVATATQYDAVGNAVAVIVSARPVNMAAVASAPTLASLQALVATDRADRVSSRTYDAGGRLVYAVDAAGTVKGMQYDGVGRLTRTTQFGVTITPSAGSTAAGVAAAIAAARGAAPTAPPDQVSQCAYNAAGQLIVATDAMNNIESSTYDALGNKLTFTNRNGAMWTYTYDAAGRMLTESTPPVSLTTTTLTAGGSITASSDPSVAVVTTLGYDALGNLTARTEASGRPEQRVTKYQYDAAGRQVRVIYPSVPVYNAAADAVTANGATGLASRVETTQSLETDTYYDALGNAVANRDVGAAVSQKVYDQMGRVIYDIDALGYVTGYARDAFGQVTSLTRYAAATALAATNVTQAAQAATRAQVQAALNAVGVDHGGDRVLVSTYDKAGRVIQTREPSVHVYDSSAPADKQTDTEAATIKNSYDAFGQLVQVARLRNTLTNTWVTTSHYFDKAGRETATIDALGYLTTHRYDAAGNLVDTIEYATAPAANSWTPGSDAPPPGADDRETRYTYDAQNRKTSEVRLNVAYSTSNLNAGADGTTAMGSVVTNYGYDAVGNQTSVQDALGNTTFTSYDALGRVQAVAAPARIVTDPNTGTTGQLTPLAVYQRDAYGNAVVQVEYAKGAQAGAPSRPVLPSDGDRRTVSVYDSFGHQIATTDATGASQYASYDPYGHAVKKWQGVTGNDGVLRTSFEVDVYDRLGHLVETRTPASTSVLQGGLTAVYTPATYSESSQTAPNKMVLGWSGLVDPAGGTVRVQVEYTATSASSDEGGNPSQSTQLASTTQDLSATAAASGATLTWTAVTSSVAYIRVLQMTGGQWVTKWEGSPAQASGSGMATLTQQQAGLVYTTMAYDSFGEMTSRGIQGGQQEYFDYDNAGRLWRTNSGDGVDQVKLYDALGNETAEIRSAGSGGSNAAVKAFLSAEAADSSPSMRRIDQQYDALGRVTSRTEAARQVVQGGATVLRQFTTASVLQSATPSDASASTFYGQNRVALAWNSLASLGSGDIMVTLQYQTALVPTSANESGQPLTFKGGTAQRYTSGVLSGDLAASGTTLTWSDPAQLSGDGGISQVTRMTVSKKDLDGVWRVVIDQAPGYGANEIDIAAPANAANAALGVPIAGATTGVTLEMRVAGSRRHGLVGCLRGEFRQRAALRCNGPGARELRVPRQRHASWAEQAGH